MQDPIEVDGDEPIEHFIGGVDDQARRLGAGVVHRAVEPSVRLHRPLDQMLHGRVVGHVGLFEGHVVARGLHRPATADMSDSFSKSPDEFESGSPDPPATVDAA
jgi:hypothetical protein